MRTIDRERFDSADYRQFEPRLEEYLQALGPAAGGSRLGPGRPPSGPSWAFLVDGQGRALPRNQAVRDEAADPRVVLEIDRFNLG